MTPELSENTEETTLEVASPLEILNDGQAARLLLAQEARTMLGVASIGSRTSPEPEQIIVLAEWLFTGEREESYPWLDADGVLRLGPNVSFDPLTQRITWEEKTYAQRS